MTSFSLDIDERRRAYIRLIGEIHHALNAALSEEHAARGLTRTEIAQILGKDKSFVTKKLAGTSNMTLETLADLAYALDRPVQVAMPARSGGNVGSYAKASPSTGPVQQISRDDRFVMQTVA